jgi:uncharacterized protein
VQLRPGDAVDVRFTKWGGGRHWEFPVTVLGEDDLGVWCGSPAGTWLERPAASFASAFALSGTARSSRWSTWTWT